MSIRASLAVLLLIGGVGRNACSASETLERTANETLTAVEMNVGDTLRFTLKNGQTRTITLESTDAEVLLSNIRERKQGFNGGATTYAFRCRVNIDGQPMDMLRYVPTQESFYEPYVINGMRIWFDGVRNIAEFLNQNHGRCFPAKDARFAIQDATLPICPQEVRPWYPNAGNVIDVRESYSGNDVWMGPYFGADAHGGLDINMPIGTPIWAPIDFDHQFSFHSLEKGHNNNRHRGIRYWDNGQVWKMQCHHLVKLTVPEETPLKQGTHYAVAAGVRTGAHSHSHFNLAVGNGDEEILLDPWIVFWQIFENNRRRANQVIAVIEPFAPARCGELVQMSSKNSQAGVTGNELKTHWDFGDGSGSLDANPTHVFARPGVYPVTLVVDDGTEQAKFVQHITVSGDPVTQPVLAIQSSSTETVPEDLAFRPRPAHVMDAYGAKVCELPRTVRFLARPTGRTTALPRRFQLVNNGGGTLPPATVSIRTPERDEWLTAKVIGSGNEQQLELSVDCSHIHRTVGTYYGYVTITAEGALNSPQVVRVRLDVPRSRPASNVIVDNEDNTVERTPYFWFAPRQHVPWTEGHAGTLLVNGGRDDAGELVRLTPDLETGRYEIRAVDGPLWNEIPGAKDAVVPVRVFHKDGVSDVEWRPAQNPVLGEFEFLEGADGHVEFHAAGSTGMIVVDALEFKRLD